MVTHLCLRRGKRLYSTPGNTGASTGNAPVM